MRMSTAIKAFGMTSSEVTELVRTNYIMTGKAGTDYFNDVTKAAMTGEKAFGYSSQMIIQDITRMSNNFETFGYRTPDQLAKISAAAHDAHMSISDLQNVMGKFNTFESAAGAVGQLNAALGTNFDALELMTLKFEDPAQMIQRLRDGFMTAGKTFEDLPATYRTMITQQLGITTEALRGIMDGSVRDIDALTAKQEDANALYDASGKSEAEKREAMDEAIKSRVKITGDMIDKAGDMVAQSERAANRFANTSNFYIERTAAIGDAINGVSSKVAETLIPKMGDLIEGAANSYSTIIMQALGASQEQLAKQAEATLNNLVDKLKQVIKDFQESNPDIELDTKKVSPTIKKGVVEPAGDLYVSPGGSTVVTANFGEMNARSFSLDSRDELVAKPPPEPAAPPPSTASRSPIPALTDAVRASLTSVGTSLRIELDVGQVTDLVLRDIMMNKPNIFGGIG
jgi:polyhydroxyalkanoate synthesis regulator phasin